MIIRVKICVGVASTILQLLYIIIHGLVLLTYIYVGVASTSQ